MLYRNIILMGYNVFNYMSFFYHFVVHFTAWFLGLSSKTTGTREQVWMDGTSEHMSTYSFVTTTIMLILRYNKAPALECMYSV